MKTTNKLSKDSHIFTARIRRMGKVIFSLCVSVHTSTGGGVPDPAMDGGGGSQVSDLGGGVPTSQIFRGGGPWSQIFRGGGYPVSVKGKIFDTRFGLIHVQTGEKIFCGGTLPPPPPPPPRQVKGKIFDTRFGLIHVQTGKKNFCQGDPPPPDSKKLLWLRGGRYASCVHAGGLSCFNLYLY